MSWFDRLKDLYGKRLIDEIRLTNAVVKGLITSEEKELIMTQ